MRALALLVLVLAPACDSNFFVKGDNIPDGLVCGTDGSCPPLQACVASENLCRRTCTTVGVVSHECGSNGAVQKACDYDHFCRPTCGMGGTMPMCGGQFMTASCPAGQVCDTAVTGMGGGMGAGICRQLCSGTAGATACTSGFTCTPLAAASGCGGCVPSALSPFDGGIDGPAPSGNFSLTPSNTSNALLAILDGVGDLWAAGPNGTVLQSTDAHSWIPNVNIPPTLTGASFNGVWSPINGEVFVVGSKATILHTQNGGGAWTKMTVPPSASNLNLNAIWGFSATNIFVVGDSGAILHWVGTTWDPQASNTASILLAVWGNNVAGSSVTYACGLNNALVRTVDLGNTWTPLSVPRTSDGNLNGLWGFGAELWIVSDSGLILRSTNLGQDWSDVSDPTVTQNLFHVWGSSPTDVWVVGQGGTVLHSADHGASWQHATTNTTSDLFSVSGIAGPPGQVVASGAGGVILLGP